MVFLAGVAGCTALELPREAVATACGNDACMERPEDIPGLLRYAEQLRRLSAEAQQREYQQVDAAFTRQGTTIDRFRLVLLLSLPEASFRNDTRARELMQRYTYKSDSDPNYRHLAELLLHNLDERRALEQTLETERKQHQLVRKQLEELKAIEQHINRREQAPPQSPPAKP